MKKYETKILELYRNTTLELQSGLNKENTNFVQSKYGMFEILCYLMFVMKDKILPYNMTFDIDKWKLIREECIGLMLERISSFESNNIDSSLFEDFDKYSSIIDRRINEYLQLKNRYNYYSNTNLNLMTYNLYEIIKKDIKRKLIIPAPIFEKSNENHGFIDFINNKGVYFDEKLIQDIYLTQEIINNFKESLDRIITYEDSSASRIYEKILLIISVIYLLPIVLLGIYAVILLFQYFLLNL